ncbi:MFS transporter [Thermoanaerobacterium saccharolyticum]|uniref:MFS transporter n=1 Tax=Thermoanaerobacterium saccharolyticum TaxID=28896 RepID=UPI002FDB961D
MNEIKDVKKERKFFGLSQNVFMFGFISLLNDLSSEITVRTLPLFLANVLGVKTSIIGLIEGVADSTATILKIFSGWFSDKVGKRKPLVVWGYALSSLSKPLFYFANSWPFVLILRFFDRVGKGIRTSPKDALIADSTEKENQGKAFGYSRAMDPLGAVIGLLIAAAVIAFGSKGIIDMTRSIYQKLVLIAAVPAIISVLLIIFFIKDYSPSGNKKGLPNLSLKGFDSQFKAFLVIIVVFTLGNSSDAFLILRAQQLGLSLFQIFIMLAMFNFVTSIVSIPAGILSDKFGRHRVIIAGWLVYGLIYLGFAFANVGWQVWILYTLYGIYYGATDGVAKALVADIVPSEKRGTAYGLYNAAIGVSALPASFIAGILWQNINPAAPFLFGSILSLCAMISMAILVRPKKEIRA